MTAADPRATLMRAPTLRAVTLGCKVNQYETEYVRQGLERVGYRDATEGEPADLCIVNTCTVTNEGDAKSRQTIRHLALHNPDARIIVMGCYATRAPQELAALPGVVEVLTDKRELPDLLGRAGVVDVPTGIARFNGRQRAFIKVQDGCLLRCSFCIIPHVRPNMYSRPLEQIVDEARRLIDNGYRELILTGIHLGHYGVDFNRGRPKADWLRLSHLVDQLARLSGEFRIRLSSIEATEVTRELIDVMGEHAAKVCPHLHVCLQSGSDTVLHRMQRRGGAQRFVDRCRLVQSRLELPALTTDVIVGFPGETDAEFAETLGVCEQLEFSKMHVFSYSRRRGTPAADMPDQVSEPLKAERHARLTELASSLSRRYYERLLGRRLQVLIEPSREARPGTVRGTSCRYAPVELSDEGASYGQFVEVTARRVADGYLEAERVESMATAR